MKKIAVVCLGLFLLVSCSKKSSSAPVFYGGDNETVNATLAASGTVTSDSRTVTIKVYIANSLASANATVLANAILAKFAGSGDSNSIYGWITNIFGSEWGSYAAATYPTQMIPDSKTISILLYDIDGDQYTNTSGAYTVGFFWARDNLLKSFASRYSPSSSMYAILTHSNQQLMFYVDLPFALKTKGTETSWSTSGYYPNVIYSTLAHEFQHMIHFYQKDIVYNSDSDTWFNEMCSVTAEDFVADKLGVEGPRGILDVNSFGSPGIIDGRLPLFNYYNMHSIIDWTDTDWTSGLDSYSTVYAFGSYLARNHGGAPLFGKLVQSVTPLDSSNNTNDLGALTNAIAAVVTNGSYGSETTDSLLREWGAAVVLSDSATGLPSKAQYNTGVATTTTSGSVTYNMGPINLYNFSYSSATGPFFGSISAAVDTLMNYTASQSTAASSEARGIPGKPAITESNRQLAALLPKNESANLAALQKDIAVPEVSATISSYNTDGSWTVSGSNQVSYLSPTLTGSVPITIYLGSATRNLYFVFSNPTASVTTAKPAITVGSTTTPVSLNNLYSVMQPYSNAYYSIVNQTGTFTATLTVPSGVVVTMVAK